MNTNDVVQWVEQAKYWVDQLYHLPNALLVGLSCVVVGYILRRWKSFPNEAIPVVVVLWGAFFTSFMAPVRPSAANVSAWRVKNALVGFIVGFAAWGLHYYVLSKLEDKFPWLKKLLVGSPDDAISPLQPPNNGP